MSAWTFQEKRAGSTFCSVFGLRYSPKVNGKRLTRNVYAHSEEECEEKLARLIREMKAEIAAEKEKLRTAEKAS